MIEVVELDFATKRERTIPAGETAAACAKGRYCWIDIICAEGSAKDAEEAASILRSLGISEMAVAEVLGADREGRYDVYEECLHFAVSEGRFPSSGRLEISHVDVVAGVNFLVTFHRKDAEFLHHMKRTYRDDFIKFARTPGFLLYEMGDHLIDGYRRAIGQIADKVEQVQLKLFGQVDDEIFRYVSDLTSDILAFRRLNMASRELLHQLGTRKSPFVSDSTQPFLESMAGTVMRLGGDLTTEREVLNETLNLYMGMVTHRTNKVINRLTVISIIFLPLSFLCGVYGMNLKGMPEMEWEYGYTAFWTVVILLAGGLLLTMRRLRWI